MTHAFRLAAVLRPPAALFLAATVLAACADGGGPGDMAVPVTVEPVTATTVPDTVRAAGSLVADEEVVLRSEVAGRVAVATYAEGASVAAGTLLFTVGTEQLGARLRQAEAGFELARRELERTRSLSAADAVPDQEVDRAESAFASRRAELALAQAAFDDGHVRAPFAGRLGLRRVSPGAYVQPGAPLGSLTDADPLEITFPIPERYAARVRLGQGVRIAVASLPGRRVAGTVNFIAPAVDPGTRTLTVKAQVPNANRELLPGMFAEVELRTGGEAAALVVPEAAVTLRGRRATVWVVDEEDRVEERRIEVDRRLPGRVLVAEGLEAGERVVVDGTQKIQPGGLVSPQAEAVTGTAS